MKWIPKFFYFIKARDKDVKYSKCTDIFVDFSVPNLPSKIVQLWALLQWVLL